MAHHTLRTIRAAINEVPIQRTPRNRLGRAVGVVPLEGEDA
jgi:hypothetical protein